MVLNATIFVLLNVYLLKFFSLSVVECMLQVLTEDRVNAPKVFLQLRCVCVMLLHPALLIGYPGVQIFYVLHM